MTGPTTLSSERLRFRLVKKQDAATLFRDWTSDPASVRYLPWKPHPSLVEAENLFARLEEETAKNLKSYYVVSDSDPADVGFASLKIEENCRAMLGFAVFTRFRRRGYGREIIQTLTRWCFSQPKLFRVYALCDIENQASMRVMEEAGLNKEGTLRRWAIHPNISDQPRDVLCYAMIKDWLNKKWE